MTLHQLLAAAAPADAVTTQALAWRRALAAHGIDGRIHAEHVHPDLAGSVETLDRFDPRAPGAVLLRYSIWSAALDAARAVPAERLGIVYHNITPGRLLEREQPALAALCDRGRRELPSLAGRVRLAVADSRYNARELEDAGVGPVRVVPLLLDVPAGPPPPARDRPRPLLVSVGRVVPSKRLEEAVRAVALLRPRMPDIRLDIIGSADGFERYAVALERFAERIGAGPAVRLRGRVSDTERDRAYAEAGAYLCTSAHEGFCAPLVEAMARGLPVVAHDAGAVAETLGGGGLVVPAGDAALTAEAAQAVLQGTDVRRALAGGAARRLRELAPAAVEPQVLAAARELVG